jgi:YgiT-type zinc finger domain-containing protein
MGSGIQEKERVMKCTICKTGQTHPGITTVTLQRDNTVVVIRDVPAEICEDCGEYYLSEPTARRVYADAEATAHRHVEVEIQRYAA